MGVECITFEIGVSYNHGAEYYDAVHGTVLQ